MIMDTIKSLLSKWKPSDTKEELTEVTSDIKASEAAIDVKDLLKEYDKVETEALQKLAESTISVAQLNKHLNDLVNKVNVEKQHIRSAAQGLLESKQKVEPYEQETKITDAYPWDYPAFLAFLGECRAADANVKTEPLGNLLTNLYTKTNITISDSLIGSIDPDKNDLEQDFAKPVQEYNASYINLLVGNACDSLGTTMSLFLQGGHPILKTQPLTAHDQEFIKDILGYLLQSSIKPILDYKFSEKSQDELRVTIPLFEDFIHSLDSLHNTTLALLIKIYDKKSQKN